MSSVHPRRMARRIVGVLLLALSLGLSQWSALAHAIAHSTGLPADSAGSSAHAGDVLELTWGHEAGTPECRLFDQLLGGQALGAEAAPMPGVPLACAPLVADALSPCRQPTLRTYLARGPPQG
jgi:hypothetical protein